MHSIHCSYSALCGDTACKSNEPFLIYLYQMRAHLDGRNLSNANIELAYPVLTYYGVKLFYGMNLHQVDIDGRMRLKSAKIAILDLSTDSNDNATVKLYVSCKLRNLFSISSCWSTVKHE